MKVIKCLILFISITVMTGCATGLNSVQQREYAAFEQDGVLIKEKNPSVGAALGILPGGGSFYAGEIGLGIVNLILWPFSVCWDPISGSNGSKVINYNLTKYHLKKKKKKEMDNLDDELILKQISNQEYIIKKRKIEEKYNYSD